MKRAEWQAFRGQEVARRLAVQFAGHWTDCSETLKFSPWTRVTMRGEDGLPSYCAPGPANLLPKAKMFDPVFSIT